MKYIPLLLILLMIPIVTACPLLYSSDPLSKKDPSLILPVEGKYSAPLTITNNQAFTGLPEGTQNITIYYTLDGSEPTITSPSTISVLKENFKLTFSTPGVYVIKLFATANQIPAVQFQTCTYTVQ